MILTGTTAFFTDIVLRTTHARSSVAAKHSKVGRPLSLILPMRAVAGCGSLQDKPKVQDISPKVGIQWHRDSSVMQAITGQSLTPGQFIPQVMGRTESVAVQLGVIFGSGVMNSLITKNPGAAVALSLITRWTYISVTAEVRHLACSIS